MAETKAIAAELMELLGTERQVRPFSARDPGFGLAQAYDLVAEVRAMRVARGETPVGRKIGFTNTTIWQHYGVSGPMWNYVFDTTLRDLAATGGTFTLAGLAEPRIEPEIVLHLARAPKAGMNEDELLGCVDWIAHGFEIVHSCFPGWVFVIADTAAAYGLHGALLLGPRHAVERDRAAWGSALRTFSLTLHRDGSPVAEGHARNVLGGPLSALRFLVEEIERTRPCDALRAGEIVTTGTLTDAQPIEAGSVWTTVLSGIDLGGLRIGFR